MTVDANLVRELQQQVGDLVEDARRARRGEGKPELRGEDERQHGRSLIQSVLTNHDQRRTEAGQAPLGWSEREELADALEARLFGAGRLQHLLDDPEVEDVDINGYDRVFVTYADGRRQEAAPVAESDDDLIETVQTLAAHVGLSSRPFDTANPRLNLRLPDGSRLYALQAVTLRPLVSIRKARLKKATLADLVGNHTMSPDVAGFLRACVLSRQNMMIAGETGAGKTTLLRALAAAIPPAERLITVERALELGLHEDEQAHPDAVALEEREANSEGVGAVSMADLVRDSLRMNPDRVIVGEVLGDEVITMLNAMSQGNDGSLSTIHANSAREVFHRIATYAIQSPVRLPMEATSMLIAGSIDFVIFMRKHKTGDGQVRRRVDSIREINGIDAGHVLSSALWEPDPNGHAARAAVSVQRAAELAEAGWEGGWTWT